MNDSTGDLRFERAAQPEGPTEPVTCGACSRPIGSTYYTVGEKLVCELCKEEQLAARDSGSGLARWLRAGLFGLGAAIVGALLWYGVAKLTGYELGLIAVVIGLMVGGAVRVGSRRRGGWVYQGLAMFLTYSAIVSTYVPALVGGFEEAIAAEEVGETPEETAAPDPERLSSTALLPGEPTAEGGDAAELGPDEADPTELATTDPLEDVPLEAGLGSALVALLFLGALVYATPFLVGFENFIGWVLIAFALYEAWKLNRREALVFEGPFRMGTGGRPEPPVATE